MVSHNTKFEENDKTARVDDHRAGVGDVFRALHRLFFLYKHLLQQVFAGKGCLPAEAMCLRVLLRGVPQEAGSQGRGEFFSLEGSKDVPRGAEISSHKLSQSDLAQILHLSRPRITALLQKLEAEGLVRREVDPCDQRYTIVSLTEAGASRAKELEKEFSLVFDSTLGALSPQDLEQLSRLLAQVGDQAEKLLRNWAERRRDVS